MTESLDNSLAFDLRQGGLGGKHKIFVGIERSFFLLLLKIEVRQRNRRPLGQHDGTLDDIFELTHVAGPVVPHQMLDGLLLNGHNLFVVFPGILLQEMRCQEGNVLEAFTQRRQMDSDDVETIIQVLAEALGSDFLGEFLIRSRHHTHIDPQRINPS